MLSDYNEWCENNKDITPLAQKMNSSLPEQYIGFYLYKAFDSEIEYQKQFPWLGKSSLDIYIPSLCLAIEYDGVYYHSSKKFFDDEKTSLCRNNGIYLIRVIEHTAEQAKSRKYNVISYYFNKNYKNIGKAIDDLFLKINKKYGIELNVDVDITRDRESIISYVQKKYRELSLAYIWPEIKDYWDNEENTLSIFDVLCTSKGVYKLKCPHCGKRFTLNMRYFYERKSLIPCDCECQRVENDFAEALRNYKELGEVVVLDNSLRYRRLYDRMAMIATKIWRCTSKEEAELYKKVGFDSQYIDVYLAQNEK